ncbi:MAG: flagellar basal body P-ring protein FlgI [Candidatus Eremiobacteraeota bacterium]|nr:flagellar basal body P-ring protein FlgI [Candidatus Eremiobacteraeota bacterium]
MMMMKRFLSLGLTLAFVFTGLMTHGVSAEAIKIKDIAKPQSVTGNQLVGYGIVTGLAGTGDTTSALFTEHTIQNVLQSFGLTTTSQEVKTRNVAAVIVTATLPPFAHSGDNIDVTVSSMGDASSLQGGTLVLTEMRAANNLVYATAQGPLSIGGFYADTGAGSTISKNHPTAGRVPNGAIIARDMITNVQTDASGFNYVLTTPDFKTAVSLERTLNARFGGHTARALDAETVHVNLPGEYTNSPIEFLADASDLQINQDQPAKVVMNERTGTIVFGGDIKLAPCAIAHGNLSITITTTNKVVPPGPFTNAPSLVQTNTTVRANEQKRQLTFIAGAATLAQVVRALNTMGVTPRDLIAIVQTMRDAGALQAELVLQ